jgi:signal peptidase I
MKPGLESGDYLVTLARTGTPARGDVIVVEHPRTAGIDLVKRAVGLPGETVEIVAGRVQIDGRALAEPWASGASGPQRTWTLGPREIFLLGDSRSHSSADGRTLGPTEVPARWWLARWRYWPPGRLGRI